MTGADLTVPLAEYAERRAQVLRALDGASAVVLAGPRPASTVLGSHRQTDSFFWYLTGLDREPGAAVLFDPSAEDPERLISLFLRPRDPEAERWEGARSPLGSNVEANTGFSSVARTGSLPTRLAEAARRTRRLGCLHPFASYECDISPDLALFKKVCERVPTAVIEDHTQVLPAMRAVKSTLELSLIERAVAATVPAYRAAFGAVRPGVDEGHVAEVMTAAIHAAGGLPAFEPIVGAGMNGTILHYSDNDQTIGEYDLVVIDYAAAVGGYASDVTRTLPASGHFDPQQRELYEIVLAANLAATSMARPGATFSEVHQAAYTVISEAGYQDHFIHSIGHHLGIDVHDPSPDGPLVPGMVITIEPGIYLADKGVGIRIEDDVLVTGSEPIVLTEAIPKTVEAIELAMAEW